MSFNNILAHGRDSSNKTGPLRSLAVAGETSKILQVASVGQTTLPGVGAIINGAFTDVSGDGVITRPANATAYTAGDIVVNNDGGSTAFAYVAQASLLGGYITRALLATSQAACTARFRLWMLRSAYTALAVTPVDNAALNFSSNDFGSVVVNGGIVLGYIDFPACASVGGMAAAQWTGQFHFTATAALHLYGLVQTLDAFTPASGQTWDITLGIERG